MPTSSLPRPILRVIGRGIVNLKSLMDGLREGMSVSQWRNDFAAEMKGLHQQALAAGYPTINNARQAITYLDHVMEAQLGFLDKWTLEIQQAPEFDEGWVARSALYALSVKQDYWTGVTHFLPLPAMPGDGTSQCLGNCGCSWRIVWLDEAHGDADAYWVLGKSDSCQTCKIRSADWAPLQIRAGDLLVTKAWPKGRHLSAAHKRAISVALRRGRHSKGGGSPGRSSIDLGDIPSNDDAAKRAAKAARAKRRRDAAKSASASPTPAKDMVIKPKDTAVDKIAAAREAKRLRAQKRREAAKPPAELPKAPQPKPKSPEPTKFEQPKIQAPTTARKLSYQEEYQLKLQQRYGKGPITTTAAPVDKREDTKSKGRDFAQTGRDPASQIFKVDHADRTNKHVQKDIDDFNSLPPHLRNQLAGAGVQIYVSGEKRILELDDNANRMNGGSTKSSRTGRDWNGSAGVYSGDANQVTVSHYKGMGTKGDRSTMLHEVGHAAGHNLNLDTNAEVRAIFAQTQRTKALNPYLLQKGDIGVKEFFAESFAQTVRNETLARSLYGDDIVNFIKSNVLDPSNQ